MVSTHLVRTGGGLASVATGLLLVVGHLASLGRGQRLRPGVVHPGEARPPDGVRAGGPGERQAGGDGARRQRKEQDYGRGERPPASQSPSAPGAPPTSVAPAPPVPQDATPGSRSAPAAHRRGPQ